MDSTTTDQIDDAQAAVSRHLARTHPTPGVYRPEVTGTVEDIRDSRAGLAVAVMHLTGDEDYWQEIAVVVREDITGNEAGAMLSLRSARELVAALQAAIDSSAARFVPGVSQ